MTSFVSVACWRSRLIWTMVAASLLISLCSPLPAEAALVFGRVSRVESPLPGGTPIAFKDHKGAIWKVTVNANGEYSILLPPGEYTAEILDQKRFIWSYPTPVRQDIDLNR